MVVARTRRLLAGAVLVAGCLVIAVVLAATTRHHHRSLPAGPGCSATAGTVSDIQAAVGRTPAGGTVCVMPGSYGRLTLTRSADTGPVVSVAPRPSLDPNRAGKVTFAGITIAGSYVTIRNVYSAGGITIGGSGGATHDAVVHDDVTNSRGYGVSILSPFGKPASDITISGNRIHATCSTCEGDALRFDGWRNVTVTGNEIYDIKECPGNGCHTDTLQSYQGDTPTGGLIITRNYVHDTFNAQGLAFLKDGDIQDVTIGDNLNVRMASSGQTNGPGIDENTVGLRITHNTYVGAGGYLEAGGGSPGASAYVAYNVFNSFNIQPPFYRLSEDHNIYTGSNQWSFKLGAHSAMQREPRYRCGARCGNGTPAGDDYRLVGAANPGSADYGVGIDWSPADQHYGPSG